RGRDVYYLAANSQIVTMTGFDLGPQIDVSAISLSPLANDGTTTVTGRARAVTGRPPLTVEIRNTNTNVAVTASVAADGSFSASVAASPGDSITVKATDAQN